MKDRHRALRQHQEGPLQSATQRERHLGRGADFHPVCCGSQVFSLVIFSSLLTDGYQNRTESPQLHCVLNSNHVACTFAVGAGFLSFLSSLVFLALDARESRITGNRFKTAFQLLDFILAGECQGTTQSYPSVQPSQAPQCLQVTVLSPPCQTCA